MITLETNMTREEMTGKLVAGERVATFAVVANGTATQEEVYAEFLGALQEAAEVLKMDIEYWSRKVV